MGGGGGVGASVFKGEGGGCCPNIRNISLNYKNMKLITYVH